MKLRWMFALMLTVACGGEAATSDEVMASDGSEGSTPHEATTPDELAGEAAADVEDEWAYYGIPFTTEETIPARALLGAPNDFVEKTVRVEGIVTDVCQGKGCWMVITDDEHHMRVIMKDHAFGVNKQGSGMWCEVEGTVTKTELDEERVAHFAAEAAEGNVIPENEAVDGIVFELVATSVRMKARDEG